MRQVNQLLKTGCFFLCLGGWVYDGQLSRADSASQAKESVLNAAVAEAVNAPTAVAQAESAKPAQQDTASAAGAAPAVTAGGSPAAPEAAKPAKVAADLNTAVVEVGVDGMVGTFSAQDLDINTALHFLSLQSHKNIIASKDVKGSVTVNLYNVTFAEALNALLEPNGFGYLEKGNFIYVYTAEELAKQKARDHKTTCRTFRLHYLSAQDASVLIKPALSSTAVVALTAPALIGLPTGIQDTGGMNYTTEDTLVINDYPENLADVESKLRELDVRPKQVLVESTILNATLSDNNALGVDIVSMSGLDFPTIGSIISPLAGSSSSSSSGSGGTTSTSATNVTTPGQLAGTLIPGAGSTHQATFGTDFANQVPSGGLTVGFLSNHVSMFVRALETVTNVSVVANPKVLTLNKHHGEVLVGRKLGYLTTTTSQTTTDQTVQFIDVGTKLVFRPFIGDNGYVRMEIHPEDSDGSIDAKGIPQKRTSEVTSNVMVKDGRTVVIGGLFRESTTASRGQVPILGNLPIIGLPFRQTSDDTERQEVIVLLTPHIINDDTALYDQSEKEAEDVHRMMIGNRAGLMPWSRDRISQYWYTEAQKQLDVGNKEKALMYVDWTLNTNPQFTEAIKLREKLTNLKMEEANQSSISEFARTILKQDAATTPDTGGASHPNPMPAPATTMPAAK